MPPKAAQGKALQEKRIVPIGGTEPITLDVQVIAATNKDITNEIENGHFRRDLFYRLNLLHIKVPTLKERDSDFDLFLKYFMEKYNPKKDMRLSKECIDILRAYDWPGNVRQLENVIERMVIISNSKIIGRECIPDEILKTLSPTNTFYELNFENHRTLHDICTYFVEKTVQENSGNITRTAEILGISRATVYKYLKNEPPKM